MNLFVYGTLLDESIMKSVTGKIFPVREAVLEGFARYRVSDECYPAIRRESEGCVHGKVYLDVDGSSMVKLDAFEGNYYRRETVRVTVTGAHPLECAVYVIREEYRHLLSQQPWTPDMVRGRKRELMAEASE